MTYRSQNWLINKTDGANWFLSSSYITGSHSMKFGYQGNWWKDDRAEYTNDQSLAYTFTGGTKAADGTFIPSRPTSITEYANPYFNNARAAMMSFFAQDQWTLKRLTLQGARALRPSVELVPGGRSAEEPVLPRRALRPGRRRHRLQRHHAAHGRRV